MTKITLEMLKAKDACSSGLALFEEKFGREVEVTLEACLAHASDIDWGWAARNLLSAKGRKAYQTAIASAWEAYQTARASAWEAYKTAIAPAEEAYKTAIASAQKAYRAARAPAFFAAWETEND